MSSAEASTRSWLRRKDWASRSLVSGMRHGVATGFEWFGNLVMLVFIPIVVLSFGFLGYITLDLLRSVSSLTRVVSVALIVATAVGVWLLMRADPGAWLRRIGTPLKPHRFECHLRTLPGVVGGWFKAEIEIEIPTDSKKPISVTLMCILDGSTSQRHAWSATYRFPAELEPHGAASFRMRLPVVFSIPADLLDLGKIEKSLLLVAVEAPDQSVYRGSFDVPIFDTTEAPPQEQEPEAAPTPQVVIREIADSV